MKKILSLVKMVFNFLIPMLKKSTSVLGIKETSEALTAVNKIGLDIAKRFQDGVGVEDFTAFWTKLQNDAEFKAIMQEGYESYTKVPAEFKDLDAGEAMELGLVQIDFIPQYIETFKKKDA